jgi:hypothetical protein
MLKVLFILFPILCSSQIENVIAIGNHGKIKSDSILSKLDSLPNNLQHYAAIFVFSGANSNLSNSDIEQLTSYLNDGGSIYLGAENWPLQAELNQVTNYLFQKECYGNQNEEHAQAELKGTQLSLAEVDNIPAGKSTVAFPLHPNLKVEAWLNDQPLILSGTYGRGRVIIDGGYSRFYGDQINSESLEIWNRIMNFLLH